MSQKFAVVLVAAATVCAPPAFADLTAGEAADWFLRSVGDAGLSVEYANERTEPGSLVLEGARLSILQGRVLTAIEPDWFRFTELEDGSVAMTIPDEIPISATGDANSTYSVSVQGSIATTDYKTIMQRAGESWLLSSVAEDFTINLDESLSSRMIEIKNPRSTVEMSGAFRESGLDDDEFVPESTQFSFDSLEHIVRPLTPGAAPYITLLKNSEIEFSRISPQETEFNAKYSGMEFRYGDVFGFGIGTGRISFEYLERSDAGDDKFSIGISIGEFALRDAFLEVLDSSGKIPRDPGNFDAKAVLNFRGGWLDEFLSEDETWNEADSLGIKRFQVQGINAAWGGASVDAAGDMRFKAAVDAEGNLAFLPAGDLDVRLDGVLELLDLFVAAGAVEAAATAGVRIFIAGMGELAAGEADSYLFHLDFEPGKPLLVNGNPSPF